tara:strand:+ start:3828 stop:3968 length:141 start_codon:yes stop_codon:yes gene_type:complete
MDQEISSEAVAKASLLALMISNGFKIRTLTLLFIDLKNIKVSGVLV